MKKILFLLALIATFSAGAQTFNTLPYNPIQFPAPARGNYGTYVGIGYVPGTICTIVLGTVTPITSGVVDTLVSPAVSYGGYKTDSGYAQFVYHSRVDKTFDLSVTALTGTLAGTAILQGSYDNATWYTITGVTTYCASCKGASATLSGSGTTHYQWNVPEYAENYTYHQILPILSGTCTATFSAKMNVSY